jgi:hypothetical protein
LMERQNGIKTLEMFRENQYINQKDNYDRLL